MSLKVYVFMVQDGLNLLRDHPAVYKNLVGAETLTMNINLVSDVIY